MKSQIFKQNVINHSLTKWLTKYWFELSLFFSSFLLRFLVYSSHPFANGWDAYFYIVQIKSYIEEGAMHASRMSLFYPILIGFYYLIQDYESTYQLVSATIVGLFSLQLYRTAKALNPKSNTNYLIASYSLLSHHLTYVGAQFPKNLLGVVIFLLLFDSLIKTNYLKVGLTAIAGIFIHKMTASLSLLLAAVFPISKILRKQTPYLFIGFILLTGILLIFPEILTSININRDGFGFGKPVLQGQKFIESLKDSITTLWITEIIMAHLLLILVTILIIKKRDTPYVWYVIVSLLLFLIYPLLEWSVLGLSYRLLMIFIIIAPLLFSYFNIQLSTPILITICIVFLTGGIFSCINYPSNQLDPPYGKYKLLTDKIEKTKGLETELLIVHKAFAEYYTFRTGKDALPWIPEYSIDIDKLWRVAYGVNSKIISYYSNKSSDIENQLFELSPWYMIIREDLWNSCITRIEQEDPGLFNELTTWKNPSSLRPNYLLKNKKN